MDTGQTAESRLKIHIEHSNPIEISDFVSTLNGVGGLFTDFAKAQGNSCDTAKAKLYVEKVEEGCIDIYMCAGLAAAALPVIENAELIMSFAEHIKKIVDFFAHGHGNKPQLTRRELENAHDMFSVSANDSGSQTTICIAGNDNTVYHDCTFNYTEANGAQNVANRERQEICDTATEATYSRVLMKIYQLRNDKNQNKGNKAIIDAISAKRINVCFDSDELKDRVLNSDENPIRKIYLVDVTVQTVERKLAAYKVTALHDVMDMDDETGGE